LQVNASKYSLDLSQKISSFLCFQKKKEQCCKCFLHFVEHFFCPRKARAIECYQRIGLFQLEMCSKYEKNAQVVGNGQVETTAVERLERNANSGVGV